LPAIPYWDDDVLNKELLITGTFLVKKFIPDPQIDETGAISTGAYGAQFVLENIKEIQVISKNGKEATSI